MKRLSLLLLALLLGGCLIITPGPEPVEPDPIEISQLTYSTSWTANDEPAICSNRITEISYSFRYTGDLVSWTSYLKGTTLGTEVMRETYNANSVGVEAPSSSEFVTRFFLGENIAPYSTGEDIQKAIVVVPVPQPVVIGYSELFLTLKGEGGDTENYVTPEIPVIENCPEN